MRKALAFLAGLLSRRQPASEAGSEFETRLQELEKRRHMSVRHAVLFRTQPPRQEV